LTLDVKKSNSSNETPNVMTVGVEKYGLTVLFSVQHKVISKVQNRLLVRFENLALKKGTFGAKNDL
jgi:hypothetical protein